MTHVRSKPFDVPFTDNPALAPAFQAINDCFDVLFRDTGLLSDANDEIVPVTLGGTGLAAWTTGDILVATAEDVIGGLAAVVKGSLIVAQGVETVPAYIAPGTINYVLTAQGSGVNPTWANPAHTLLSATHTDTLVGTVLRGDLVVGNSTPKWSRFAIGAANSVLFTDGTDPSWSTAPTISGANITLIPETAIVDGAILARVAGNETISGTWRFSVGIGIGVAAAGQIITGALAVPGDWAVILRNTTTTAGLSYGLRLIAGTNSGDTAFTILDANLSGTLFDVRGDGATKWGGGTVLASSSTAVTPATYGSVTESAVITVDQGGRITAASNVAIVATAAAHDILSASHGDALAAAVARGAVIIGNATPKWSRLTVGSAGNFLRSDGADVSWGVDGSALTTLNAGNISSGTLAVARGGTGLASYAVGDLIYASGATTLIALADVAVGSYLRSGGVTTAPLWSTLTLPNTAAISTILYASAANVVSALATANSGILVTSSGGVPSIATDIPTAVTIGGAAIYRAGGTDVAVADGGTGASTLTGLLLGNGTSAVTAITTSAGILGAISDETGTGALVFGTSPVFTTQISTPAIKTASGALTVTPAAGSGVSFVLSTTGDFAINTSVFFVKTSTSQVCVATTTPASSSVLTIDGSGGSNVVGIGLTTSTSGVGFGLYNTNANAARRNWAMVANFVAYGDFAITQSTTAGGDPLSAGSNSKIYIDATGKVGIGTAAPVVDFHLLSTTGFEAYIERGATTNYAVLTYKTTGGNVWATGCRTTAAVGTADTYSIYCGALGANAITILNSGNVGIGTTGPASRLHVSGGVQFASELSPASITASQNDYAPTGFATAFLIRLTSNNNWNITGLAGGAAGRIVILVNIGAFQITLTPEDAASTAANRFTSAFGKTILAGLAVVLIYDSTTSRWTWIG